MGSRIIKSKYQVNNIKNYDIPIGTQVKYMQPFFLADQDTIWLNGEVVECHPTYVVVNHHTKYESSYKFAINKVDFLIEKPTAKII